MNNLQIESLVSDCPNFQKHFKGVFARDTLPSINKTYPSSYICNLDIAAKEGSHWIAFYFPDKSNREYFDSYGFPPLFDEFLTLLQKNFLYNGQTIQSHNTATCGQHCIHYLWERSNGKSLEQILMEMNRENLLVNDLYVNREVENHFSVDLDVFNKSFDINQMVKSYQQLKHEFHEIFNYV